MVGNNGTFSVVDGLGVSSSEETSMKILKMLGLAVTALVSASLIVLIAGLDIFFSKTPHSLPAGSSSVTVRPTYMEVGCPRGIIDPFALTSNPAPSRAWSSLTGAWTIQSKPVISDLIKEDQEYLPSTLALSAQGGGEIRGLSLLECTQAKSEQWIAAGSTVVGENATLVLVNPSVQPSQVRISALGSDGPIDGREYAVTVPAGETQIVALGTYFPGEERLAVKVIAEGPGVVAWVQSTGLDGERPLGATTIESVQSSEEFTFVGLSQGATGSVLRVGVPGEAEADVSVSMISADGEEALDNARLTVAAGTVIDLPIGAVTKPGMALKVTSNVAVVASFIEQRDGTAMVNGQQWRDRSAVGQVDTTTSIALPGLQDLSVNLTAAGNDPILRASGIEAAQGMATDHSNVVILNPSTTTDANVTLPDGSSVVVPAGRTHLVPLPSSGGILRSDLEIYVALETLVDTPTGKIAAHTALGGVDATPRSYKVQLRNS